MGNDVTTGCAETLTLDDIEAKTRQYSLNMDAKRLSLGSIETRPNLKPTRALNTSKKAHKSTHNYIYHGTLSPNMVYSKSCDIHQIPPTKQPNLRINKSNPSFHKKPIKKSATKPHLSMTKRSQSLPPDSSNDIKPIKQNKRHKKMCKSHKKSSKQKHHRSMNKDNSNTKMEAKYIAQEVETTYLRKQNEKLKRQNELLRMRLTQNVADISGMNHSSQITMQQTQSASRSNKQRLKLNIAATHQQRPILHLERDNKHIHVAMKENKERPISPLVSPLPALEPIYSTDNGDEFEQYMKFFSVGHGVRATPATVNEHVAESEENIWSMHFDGNCANIEECIAMQRMIRALKWYSKLNGDADSIWKKIKDKKYNNNLVNDYHHVMHYHLNDKIDTISMKRKKKIICDEIHKIVNKCDIKSCKGYNRKNCGQNEHIPFYVGCIDTIHCYFMHSDVL